MSEGATPPSRGEESQIIEAPDLHGCTALVLGAGASQPYGFPIGVELVDDIRQHFPDFFERLDAYGSTSQERRSKANDLACMLKDAACHSIDEFLADHAMDAELVRIGKIAISSSLLPKEDEEKLRGSRDWYEHLIHLWCRNPTKLGVITFNYDRSFEHRFWLALNARDSQGGEWLARDNMVISETQRIHVTHVHGQFGDLPWQAPEGNGVPYGVAPGEDTGARVLQAARQLRLMFETASDMRLAEARHTLVRASRVIFLGFGYDKGNLARIVPALRHETLYRDASIAGTAFGLTPTEVEQAKENLRRWAGDGWSGETRLHGGRCLEAIRENNWLG